MANKKVLKPFVLEALQALAKEPRQTPLRLARKLSVDPRYIRPTMRTLHELGLVTAIEHGVYEITALGQTVLDNNNASSSVNGTLAAAAQTQS